MSYFEVKTRLKLNAEILQQVEIEQRSLYALEHMLGYHINELEELKPHKRNIEFLAESNYNDQPDLIDLSHWLQRIKNIENSIKKNEELIINTYEKLFSQIILKMINDETLSQLDRFFYQSKNYIEKIRSGEITLRELAEDYDWEQEKFRNFT